MEAVPRGGVWRSYETETRLEERRGGTYLSLRAQMGTEDRVIALRNRYGHGDGKLILYLRRTELTSPAFPERLSSETATLISKVHTNPNPSIPRSTSLDWFADYCTNSSARIE